MENKITKYFIIGTFVSLYILVSIISTIHVIEFFELSNPRWLAITLAVAFEIGAAASLASIIALDKMNKFVVWVLFFVLTAMQAMGNTFYAYVNLENYQPWVELFGLVEEEVIFQKRILSLVSGGILPLVALGFIKSLVDYMKPDSISIIPTEEDKPIIQKDELIQEEINTELPLEIDSIPTPIVENVPEEKIEPQEEENLAQLEIPFEAELEPFVEEKPEEVQIENTPQLEIPFEEEDSEKKN